MEQVGEWCRDNLSGAAIEVNSTGSEGVTVSLPYELQSLSSILAALTERFDVDVDFITGDNGGELKIYRDHGAPPPPAGAARPAAAVAAGPSSWWWWPGALGHLAWAAACAALLLTRAAAAPGANTTTAGGA